MSEHFPLTREKYESAVEWIYNSGMTRSDRRRLLAHDAALRAQIVNLRQTLSHAYDHGLNLDAWPELRAIVKGGA